MTPPTQMDRRTFWRNLKRSKLLTRAQLQEVLKELPDSPRGRVVARHLVDRGYITKFQAELLLIGRTSGFQLGQYRILEQLGQGGMGRVFKAEHTTMKRVVALKVLAPHLVETPRAEHLFQKEVRAAAQLIHPNIVTSYDANQIKNRHFLVMEYVDGPNLDQLIREMGPLPVGVACEIIRQAAIGLQYAGETGMVHRDIKPPNLLVHKVGKNALGVKILDFGLARFHAPEGSPEDSTLDDKPHTIVGTPDYLSPEQARHEEIDIRTDLYSLGATFYYLLTGIVPYPGGTTLEKLVRHCKDDPKPIDHFRGDVPADVIQIVKKLMAKRREDRFQTPAEVATAIAPFAVNNTSFWQGTPIASLSMDDFEAGISSAVTFPPDFSPTPLSSHSVTPWGTEVVQRRVFWIVLLYSLGIVSGVLGLFFLILLLAK